MKRWLWISRVAVAALAAGALLSIWNLVWVLIDMRYTGHWPWLTRCVTGGAAPYPPCYQSIRVELLQPPALPGPPTVQDTSSGSSGYYMTGPTEVSAHLLDTDGATRSALHAGPAVWWLVIISVLVLLLVQARRLRRRGRPARVDRTTISIGLVIAIGGSLACWLMSWGRRYAIERNDSHELLRSAYDFSYLPLVIGLLMMAFGILVRANSRLRVDVDGLV